MADVYENIYERGRVTWFSSEDEGGPDVGIAVGLGSKMALYAGDLPNPNSHGFKLYSENEDFPSVIIADGIDPEGSRTLMDALAFVLAKDVS